MVTQRNERPFTVIRTQEERNMQRLYHACMSVNNEPIGSIADYNPLGEWLDIGMELYKRHTEGGHLDVKRYMVRLQKEDLQTFAALSTLAGDILPAKLQAPTEVPTPELPDHLIIGKQGKTVFKTYSEDDIDAFPDPEYEIDKILQTATVSLLYGPSNTGKTFLALDIAQCKARGLPWLGRRVKQGRVLYIYAEGKIGLKPRNQAWKKHHNELSTTSNLKFITVPVQLVGDKQTMLDTLAEQEEPFDMVIFDTFSNCAVDVDQNKQEQVYRALATAHEIVREFGSHVMVIHHANKQDMFNGTAAFRNHVDTMIKLSKADDYSPIVMHCDKQRDADRFADIAINLEIVPLYTKPDTLETVTSCVIVAGEQLEQEKPGNATEDAMLDILATHGRMSANKWLKACQDANVCKSSSFYTHIRKLVAQNSIQKDESLGQGKEVWYQVVTPTTPTTP